MFLSVLAASGLAGVALYLGYKKLKSKPEGVIKAGDYVLLRHSYFQEYPSIPKNHALTVDKVEGEVVTVYYMKPSEILRATVKKQALRKAS